MKFVLRNGIEYPVLKESETCYLIRVGGTDLWISKVTAEVVG